MLQMEEAVDLLCAQVQTIQETEEVELLAALGRLLGEDCVAQQDQPPFPRSPLDGYAVRGADTASASPEHPVRLRVVGKLFAGGMFDGTVGPGEAVRIMTGAPIPKGADTVIRQEDTDCGIEAVFLYSSSLPYQNYCPAGEDYKKGDILLEKGTVLNGAAVSVLAGAGRQRVRVLRRPRIAVISTGDEVLQPGTPLTAGKIYDSNRFYVTSRLMELNCPPVASLHCGDDAEALAEEIRRLAPSTNLILTIGGVSVGEKDILHRTLELLGAERLFWRLAVKPGSPTLAARFGSTLLLCLSGNPFGAAVHFELLARPVLARLTGNPRLTMKRERKLLRDGYPKGAKMRRFLRGCVQGDAVRLAQGNQAAGALSAMARADCLLELPAQPTGFPAGKEVWVYLL